jgi:hypothetical protein
MRPIATLVGAALLALSCGVERPVVVGSIRVDGQGLLGPVACGQSAGLAIRLRNEVPQSVVHWMATASEPFSVLGTSSGDLRGDETVEISVRAAVPLTATPSADVTGTLHLTTNDPNQPEIDIPLSVTPRGALLRVPSFPVELGDVPLGKTSPPVDVTVVNDGDLPAQILAPVSPNKSFTVVSAPSTLAPGASGVVQVQFSPGQLGDAQTTVPLATVGPLCGLPEVKLHAKGTNGKALISPGALDFGLVDCGTTAGAKTVTVQNVGDADFDVDAALTQGTHFVVSPKHVTVAPNVTAQLTITPAAIPQTSAVTPDLYGDTLTITTTSQGDLPHVLPIHETAHGAILDVTLPQGAIRARVDDVVTKSVTVTNTGNAPAIGAVTSTHGTLAIPALNVAGGATANATLEVRADPKKLGLDASDPLSWNVGPLCGTGPSSGLVRAYDTVLDGDGSSTVTCAIGHSHRVYCWGDNAAAFPRAPLAPLTYATPELVPNEVADRLSFGQGALWLHTDGGPIRLVRYQQPPNLLPFGGPFSSVRKNSDSGNHGWCGVEVTGAVRCRGNEGNGRFGDGPCANGGTDTAFQSLWPLDDVGLSNSRGYAVKSGAVWATTPCGSGNSPPLSPTSLVNVTEIIGGSDAACARRLDGSVGCWLASPSSDVVPNVQAVPLAGATRIHVRGMAGWAALNDGTVVSWNLPTSALYPSSGLSFPAKLFGYGGFSICGIRPDGAVLCGQSINGAAVFSIIPGFEGP